MRELIDRLDVVDGGAANALRVIDHFDRLVEARATTAALLRAAAALAGCPAGFHDAGSALTRRFAIDGRVLPGDEDHIWPRLAVPGRPGSFVWLERVGAPGPLDPLVLERCARAVQSLTERVTGSTKATIRIACDPDASAADRRDAAARLGLSGSVTVVVTGPSDPASSRSAQIGDHVVTLFPGRPVFPADMRAGAASADHPTDLPIAVSRALIALRVTDRVDGPGASTVSYEDLGAQASVAERFTPEQAAVVPDVHLIEKLRRDRPWLVDTLQAVLDQPSLRQAASVLHVHHSTLRERLDWMETHLGYPISQPGGRQRAAATVLLWRIAHGAKESHG